jgi:hypothetical protein
MELRDFNLAAIFDSLAQFFWQSQIAVSQILDELGNPQLLCG